MTKTISISWGLIFVLNALLPVYAFVQLATVSLIAAFWLFILLLVCVGVIYWAVNDWEYEKAIFGLLKQHPYETISFLGKGFLVADLYMIGGIFLAFTKTGYGTNLWNPYIYGGMPGHAVGFIGTRYWNMIEVFCFSTINYIFCNPLFALLFVLSFWYWIKRYNWWSYALLLVVEISMILTTEVK